MLATQMPDVPLEAEDVKQVKQAKTFPAYGRCSFNTDRRRFLASALRFGDGRSFSE